MKKAALIVLLSGLIPSLAGCNNGSSGPALASPTNTETFTGTVQPGVGNLDFHNFTVEKAGEVDVSLTAAGPPSTIIMGVVIGNGGSSCSFSSSSVFNLQAQAAIQLSGPLNPGTYCVAVIDVGNAAQAITYTVVVAHP